ncbi:MAG: hypothetical protein HKN29_01140 [Rhodothermales bacterium]|nr:hypothetical protein [Rhodothermales bacterium]
MSRRDEILGQLTYLVDELEAQIGVIGLIPHVLWDARPPEAATLREMYASMLEREHGANRTRFGLEPQQVADSLEPAELLSALAGARSELVSALEGTDFNEEVAYQITQEDTDALRRVAERLHETSMGTPQVKAG